VAASRRYSHFLNGLGLTPTLKWLLLIPCAAAPALALAARLSALRNDCSHLVKTMVSIQRPAAVTAGGLGADRWSNDSMSRGIFLIQPDQALIELQQQPYESEDLLQRLLAEHPNVMAGVEADTAVSPSWVLISRERSVPDGEGNSSRWSVDHLFLDQDAVPTLVEVKRASDTRLRREVVAQMLDYAAHGVIHWSANELRDAFEKTCTALDQLPEEILASVIDEGENEEEYWRRVDANLRAGRIRMLFVSDRIPAELQRIIEFLNEQMNPATVLAIEVRQFIGQGHRALVPTLIGQTSKAQKSKSVITPREPITEEEWLQNIRDKQGEETSALSGNLLAWLRTVSDRIDFSRAQDSIYASVMSDGSHRYPVGISNGRVFISPGYLKAASKFASEQERRELIERVKRIPGITLSTENVNGFPSFNIEVLRNKNAMKSFKETIEWVFERLRSE